MNYSSFKVNFQKEHLARTFKYVSWILSIALFFSTCFALLLPNGESSDWSGFYHRIYSNHDLNCLGIATAVIFSFLVISYGFHLYFWKKYVEDNPLNIFLLISILLTFATWVLMLVGTNPNLEPTEDPLQHFFNLFVQFRQDDEGAITIKYTTEGAIMVMWVSICAVVQVCIYSFDFYINHFKMHALKQEKPVAKKQRKHKKISK